MKPAQVMAYGVLGLPLAFAALPVYVHVPHFYAEVSGLDIAWLGFVLLVARLLDAGIDPWLGWLADRVPRRYMLLLALCPFGLGFVALLNPPSAYAAYWLLGSLILTYLGFSAATVAYQAWGADLGANSGLRTRLTAAREGFGLVGSILAAALPSFLAASLSEGIGRLSWVLPPLLLLAALITLGTFRRDSRQAMRPDQQGMRSSLRLLLNDAPFVRLVSVFVANGIAAALPATLFLFFVADVLQAQALSGLLLALYFVAGAASLPLWVRLAGSIGRVRTWFCSMGLSIIAFAGAGLLGAGDVSLFALICLASGLALGADLALPAAMAADMGGRTGQTGSCFGIWNFVAKLNLALAAGLALPVLAWLGYQPGSGEGLLALSLAYALLPLTFKLLAAALLWRWRHLLENAG